MQILKRENWWVWLLLFILSGGTSTIVLAALLDCYEKDAWYAKPKNWVIGVLCFLFPAFIMMYVLLIQMLCQISAKLNVPGKELYLSPYMWLILLIVPVFGWIFFTVAYLYLNIWYIVMLYKGEGEKYIK